MRKTWKKKGERENRVSGGGIGIQIEFFKNSSETWAYLNMDEKNPVKRDI